MTRDSDTCLKQAASYKRDPNDLCRVCRNQQQMSAAGRRNDV